MAFKVIKNRVLFFVLISISCGSEIKKDSAQSIEISTADINEKNIILGASRTNEYLPLLKGKRIGIIANQTSVIYSQQTDSIFEVNPETNGLELYETKLGYKHLVDSLLELGVNIKKVFAPEHGFRGKADAGELVKDGIDTKTGIPIISLYGKNKKPYPKQLADIDIILFDIQDVGARFYTYISTLHYVMEACAEQNIPVMVLDRPNPNGHYIDGPILETEHKSFVGMHPIPIVHGMTIGEYAKMINGEGWLESNVQCDLTIISMYNYSYNKPYSLPIKPSPNLPNDTSINLYPSLCLFEGTNVSAGRGTEAQFQVFGSPFLSQSVYDYIFTPQPNEGAKHPKHKDVVCYGKNLKNHPRLNNLNLNWLINAYNSTSNKTEFFIPFFTKLVGTKKLQQQIEQGLNAEDISKSWQNGLEKFKSIRQKYLIYN